MRTPALFNHFVASARSHLRCARIVGGFDRLVWLGYADGCMRSALREANRMRDRKRQALCLKILNWLRADLRRLSA